MFALVPGRFAALSRTGSGRTRLSLELEKWLALNYWTPFHVAKLTELCCPPPQVLIPREVARIVSGSMLDLLPKHFQAFARIEALVRQASASGFRPDSDQHLLACFASSICCDDSAQRASWWFGVYCNEDWALECIRVGQSLPTLEMAMIGKLLPGLLRRSVAKNGQDPVDFLRESVQRLPASSALRPQTFVDWILDYDRLDVEAVRLALPFVLMLLTELGSECKALSEFSVASHG